MINRNDKPNAQALASALADAIAADLKAGIAETGTASLAVSGGSTPAKFFEQLAIRTDVDWTKVVVTLVDERWVEGTSDRSNALLVNSKLLQGPAAAARFVPIYTGGARPTDELIAKSCALLHAVKHPFDAVIFGMGNDGHTASFFPGADHLEAALNDDVPALAMTAPGADEPRITLSLRYLLATRSVYLHIEGAAKAETLERAMSNGPIAEMPVRAVLRQTEKPVNVFWCP